MSLVMFSRLCLTCNVQTTDGHHEIEIRSIEAATGDPGYSQQDGQHEEKVDPGGEGAAVAGLLWEDVNHDGACPDVYGLDRWGAAVLSSVWVSVTSRPGAPLLLSWPNTSSSSYLNSLTMTTFMSSE